MNLKRRERLLAWAVILCLVVLLGDRAILSPLITLWQERSARILHLETSLDEGRSLLAREAVLTGMWNDMRRRSLPSDTSAGENEVFKSVSRWAEESRLEITSLTPRWTQGEEDFRSLEFRASAQGDLEPVVRFLYELESDPLPLKVDEIEISARDDQGEHLSLGVRFSALLLTDGEIGQR